jgi:hypothetical protein
MPYVVDERLLLEQAYTAAATLMGPGRTAEKLRLAVATFRTCLAEVRQRHLRQARTKTSGANEARRRFNR